MAIEPKKMNLWLKSIGPTPIVELCRHPRLDLWGISATMGGSGNSRNIGTYYYKVVRMMF